MDTQNLQAFCAVAELSSFSLAATRLHLTQPAVTRRIQLLEAQIGKKLFDRIARQVSLTEAGQCLLPYAINILRLMETSRQVLDDLSGHVQGQLKLVTSHHIGLHRLPGVLQQYKQRYPAVKLNIQFFNSQETWRKILDSEGDLGITTLEPVDGPVVAEDIWLDHLRFVVAHSHPLASGKPVNLRQLADYSALLPDARFFTGRVVRELFADRNIPLQVDHDLSTDYLETIKALVSIGQSWSVLPESMLQDATLALLDVTKTTLTRRLVCIHHQGRSLSQAALAFLEVLRSYRDRAE